MKKTHLKVIVFSVVVSISVRLFFYPIDTSVLDKKKENVSTPADKIKESFYSYVPRISFVNKAYGAEVDGISKKSLLANVSNLVGEFFSLFKKDEVPDVMIQQFGSSVYVTPDELDRAIASVYIDLGQQIPPPLPSSDGTTKIIYQTPINNYYTNNAFPVSNTNNYATEDFVRLQVDRISGKKSSGSSGLSAGEVDERIGQYIHSSSTLSVDGSITATTFYGDGSNLTGLPDGFSSEDLNALNPVAVGFENATSTIGSSASMFGVCNTASGSYSSALGFMNTACGSASTASGYYNTACGNRSSASGYKNLTFGNLSSAFGYYNVTCENNSSAIGFSNTSGGCASSALGYCNTSSGYASTASGFFNTSSSYGSTASGYCNTASGYYSSAIGACNAASVGYNTASGYGNTSSAYFSSAIGYKNIASACFGSALGACSRATANFSSASGYGSRASGIKSTASGYISCASGACTSALGTSNTASGNYSSASGYKNVSSALNSQMFGSRNFSGTTGLASVAFGLLNNSTGATLTPTTGVITGTASAATTIGKASTAVGIKNLASADQGTAVGYFNTASCYKSSALGFCNTASNQCTSASGYRNVASGICSAAFGFCNCSSTCRTSTFGVGNTSSAYFASAFGYSNTASAAQAVSLGFSNTASGYGSAAVGRSNNSSSIRASTFGISNTASNYCSSAFGYGNTASGLLSSTHGSCLTNANNCSAMIGVNTGWLNVFDDGSVIASNGACLTAGGTWTNSSDVNLKENFESLNADEVLEKINSLNIQKWNYKSEDSSITHIGPMAQDFYAVFSLGGSDKSISTIDPAGVALIGIQALSNRLDSLENSTSTNFFSTISIDVDSLDPLTEISPIQALLTFGAKIVDGVAYLTNVFVERLTIGNTEKPGSITIYSENGNPFCITVSDEGELKTESGTCIDGPSPSPETGNLSEPEEETVSEPVEPTPEEETEVEESQPEPEPSPEPESEPEPEPEPEPESTPQESTPENPSESSI